MQSEHCGKNGKWPYAIAIKHHEHGDYHQQRKLIALTNLRLATAMELDIRMDSQLEIQFQVNPSTNSLKWSEQQQRQVRRVLWTFSVSMLLWVKWLIKINKTLQTGH